MLVQSASYKVRDFMTEDVVFVEIPSLRKKIIELIKETGHLGFPVVKKETGEFVGLITRRDLMRNPREEQVSLLMNRNVSTVTPDSPLAEAVRVMLEKKQRYVPVVDVGKKLVGIITVADVVQKFLARSKVNDPISQYVERKVPVVWHRTPVKIAFKMMSFLDTNVLVVLDDNGDLYGIVTDYDIMKLAEETVKKDVKSMKARSESQSEWESDTILYIFRGVLEFPEEPIGSICSKDVITAWEDSTVHECAVKMRQHNIDQIPVLSISGKIVGIIYDFSLLPAALKNLSEGAS